MDFDPTELVRTLGSLASIASGYFNVKKAIVDGNPARRSVDGDLQGTLSKEETTSILQQPIRASAVSPQDKAALQVISREVLESATERMKAAQERYVQAIKKGQISEIEEEEAITRREVCFFLSTILINNLGRFPLGTSLEIVWQQFRCTPLYPQYGIRSGY